MVLPVIDFSQVQPLKCNIETIFENEETQNLAKCFYNALSTYGFLYISGHGIPEEEIKAAFKASKSFFKPKNKAIHSRFYRKKSNVILGYVDGINERDLPENPIDLKQGFDFTLNSPQFDSMPTKNKPPLKSLYHRFEKLSQFVLRLLGLALGAGVDYFMDGHQKMGDIKANSSTMRILYYKPVNGEVLDRQSRMSEHTDFGTFTMLIQDEVGGLQVMCPNENRFIDAEPIKNTIVFNVGDLLQSWSVGKLKSTLHRVVLPNQMIRLKKSRQSIVYFTNPDNSYVISSGQDENGNKEKKRTKSVEEHIDERNTTTIMDLSDGKWCLVEEEGF